MIQTMIRSTEINSNQIYECQDYFKQGGNLTSHRAHYDVTVMLNQTTRFDFNKFEHILKHRVWDMSHLFSKYVAQTCVTCIYMISISMLIKVDALPYFSHLHWSIDYVISVWHMDRDIYNNAKWPFVINLSKCYAVLGTLHGTPQPLHVYVDYVWSGSDYGFSLARRQIIIWLNGELLLIGRLQMSVKFESRN